MKLCDILTVKNSMVKSAYCITEFTVCCLVSFVPCCGCSLHWSISEHRLSKFCINFVFLMSLHHWNPFPEQFLSLCFADGDLIMPCSCLSLPSECFSVTQSHWQPFCQLPSLFTYCLVVSCFGRSCLLSFLKLCANWDKNSLSHTSVGRVEIM